MLNFFSLALCSLPLLAFVQFNPWLQPWQSRKVLHMGTGTLFMLADMTDVWVRLSVYGMALVVMAAVGSRSTFHFAEVGDIGIVSYLFFCAITAFLRIPFWQMAPLFYADPSGAIVGRSVRTPKLVGEKSVGGTLAVGVVAALTMFHTPWTTRLLHGTAIATIELFAGKWDNPAISTYLLLRVI